MISITSAGSAWLDVVGAARSIKTHHAYKTAMIFFSRVLRNHSMDPDLSDINTLTHRAIIWLADDLKHLSPSTERLYLGAIRGFYKFLMADELAVINMAKIEALITQRSRRPGKIPPQFAAVEIKLVLNRIETLPISRGGNQSLIDLRDKALIITLAHTGLRIHEACNLKRGDVDLNEGQALVLGKGNKQALVRFTKKSLDAIRAYLKARAQIDGVSGKSLSSLPIFARHDAGTGKKVKPITTETGRAIVKFRIHQLLSGEEIKRITPHSFRHYFVTEILRTTHNLKLAQGLARHENIEMTQRYAHLTDDELDRGYHKAFEEDNE